MTINNLIRVPVIGDVAGVYFVKHATDSSLNGVYVKAQDNAAAIKVAANGLTGLNYTLVVGGKTATENAAELQAAYNNISSEYVLSATNRFTIIVSPGKYTFTSSFLVAKPFVDIVSLTGNPDVILNGINITSNDNYIKGIQCVTNRFQIANNLNLLIVENCISLVLYSFKVGNTNVANLTNIVSGKFYNCKGGTNSFGGKETASGIFENCNVIGSEAFGAVASGIFTNCSVTLGGSFGGSNANGTFKNCTTGDGSSFGGYNNGVASGNFYDCKASSYHSFGDIASGNFYNCIAGPGSFGGGYLNIKKFTGKAYNCIAGEGSFGRTVLTGKLYFCKIEYLGMDATLPKTFTTVTETGKTRYCIDDTDDTNNQG